MIVLLSELGQPGTGEIVIAFYRAAYTLAGGLMAVAGGLLLWPSWEPPRVRDDLLAAIGAHAAYADAELATLMGEAPIGSADTARRAAGLASNNLETTLSRALQEPGHRFDRELQVAMVADAALRRTAGRLAGVAACAGSGWLGRDGCLARLAEGVVRRAQDRRRPARAGPARSG